VVWAGLRKRHCMSAGMLFEQVMPVTYGITDLVSKTYELKHQEPWSSPWFGWAALRECLRRLVEDEATAVSGSQVGSDSSNAEQPHLMLDLSFRFWISSRNPLYSVACGVVAVQHQDLRWVVTMPLVGSDSPNAGQPHLKLDPSFGFRPRPGIHYAQQPAALSPSNITHDAQLQGHKPAQTKP